MLYDRRQRPQVVYLDDKVHIVFNAGGQIGARPKAPTKPMAVTYDPVSRQFSEVVTLGPGSRDHHYGPVIWADDDGCLHVLFGCHRTPGRHLISKHPGSIGTSLDSWDAGAQIAPSISYPTIFRIYDNMELIYYRTDGHTSSWTYRITDDNGKTWTGPSRDVTDMDIKGRTEWSSYHTTLPSRDGKFLHDALPICALSFRVP
ncbi:MAG: BNR-4 repeat-containing protein [Planctomycetes bacterium]|nr:BNR-4 repeat-containing protein [Planctomycetota bacterium]